VNKIYYSVQKKRTLKHFIGHIGRETAVQFYLTPAFKFHGNRLDYDFTTQFRKLNPMKSLER